MSCDTCGAPGGSTCGNCSVLERHLASYLKSENGVAFVRNALTAVTCPAVWHAGVIHKPVGHIPSGTRCCLFPHNSNVPHAFRDEDGQLQYVKDR